CGDVNGIGLEIFFKMFNENSFEDEFAISINQEILIDYFKKLNFKFEFNSSYLKISGKTIKVIECENKAQVEFGKISRDAGKLAIESLDIASNLVNSNEYNALIT